MLNREIANHHLVQAFWSAVNTSSGSLTNVAPLVKKILETGAWKKRIVPELGDDPVQFDHFAEFITIAPLRGCGWPLDKVEALIRDDATILEMWHRAIKVNAGTNQYTMVHNNVMHHKKVKQGNSLAYTLNRLKREQPDLFKKVEAKEMSANAAAIEAGFRKKLTRFEQIKRWLPKLSPEERSQLKALL